ncbi:MAG TPA: anaerobic ribonucleoside-triphosphate reductase activating protein [Clostridiaceae bacterium]|jgi:pyruvate formate lyase activating enzyme|nr:anaerobic ribonucleoside-triphosphate reductase activating protein [Clostridiaceae bacterium]
MNIAGLEKNSFVDYPGKMAAVIFTPGCNMNCFYCHNQILLSKKTNENILNKNEVMNFLKARKGFLDAVVISGGEPTLQPELLSFLEEVKGLGFLLKLDTNGTNPGILKEACQRNLVDYVAMDIKAPLEKYYEICRTKINTDLVQESIKIVMESGVDYEFRTTFAPPLTDEDIIAIAQMIEGANLYVIQKVRYLYPLRDPGKNPIPHTVDYIMSILRRVKPLVKECKTRGYEMILPLL